jgi:putative exosortase-associated protein (TIGR04073 family)
MRKSFSLLAVAVATAFFGVGCAGPEAKLGRGVRNVTEFARMGEIRRSVEQSTLWDGADVGATTGFITGFRRSMGRTLVGAYEIVTFPLPSYDPIYGPDNPVYPDSYKPGHFADQTFATDYHFGFSGGEVAPMIPGSRFKIFDE